MHLDRFSVRAALAALAVTLSSCAGYHVGAIKPERMKDVHSIAVPTFKNMTLEPKSSVLITNEVVTRLQQDGTYKVGSTTDADATLKGTIREVRRRQLRSARFNTLRTNELQVEIFVNYTLEDNRTHTVISEGLARGSTSVFLDQNFQLSERQGLNEAAANMAQELVTRLAEGIPGQTGLTGRARSLSGSDSGF